MRRFLQAIWVLCFVTSSWGYSAATPKIQGPGMVIKSPVADFGEVMEGAEVNHTFDVINEGDQTLLIKDVKPG
ncbi:MAG: DUF1573 domain-containing protein [Desulfatiglandaceae bacterium]